MIKSDLRAGSREFSLHGPDLPTLIAFGSLVSSKEIPLRLSNIPISSPFNHCKESMVIKFGFYCNFEVNLLDM